MEEKKVTFKADGSYQRGELKDMEVRKGSHEKKGESVDMTLGNKIPAAASKGNTPAKQGYDLSSLKKKGKPNTPSAADKATQEAASMAKTSVSVKAAEDVAKAPVAGTPAVVHGLREAHNVLPNSGYSGKKEPREEETTEPAPAPVVAKTEPATAPAPVEVKAEPAPAPVEAPVEAPKEEVKAEPVKVETPTTEPVKTAPIEVKKMDLDAGLTEKVSAPAVVATPVVTSATAPKDKTFTVVPLAELLGDQENWDGRTSATRTFINACLKAYVGKPTAVFESVAVPGLRMYTHVPKTASTRLLALGRGEKLSVMELSNSDGSVQDASQLIKLDSALAIVEDTVVLFSASTKAATQTL